jgi:hypothetical protein
MPQVRKPNATERLKGDHEAAAPERKWAPIVSNDRGRLMEKPVYLLPSQRERHAQRVSSNYIAETANQT